MQYRTAKGFSGPAAIGIFLALVGMGLILTGIVQFLLAMSLLPAGTGMDQMEAVIKKLITDPANVNVAILMQAAGTFLLMFVPACLFSLVAHGRSWHWLGFSRNLDFIQIGLAFLIIFAANLAAIPFDQLSRSILSHFPAVYHKALQMEAEYAQQVEALGSLRSFPGFFIGLVSIAFLPSLFEETFFRGAFQNLLVRWWGFPFLAILFTSVVFSLIHISFFLFIGRAILGFALGLIFYYTRNIWVNIVAHFLNNAIAFSQMFYAGGKAEAMEGGSGNVWLDWLSAIAAVVASFFLFRYLKKRSASHTAKIEEKEKVLETRFS